MTTTISEVQLPPHDLQAEEAVLGVVLKSPSAIHQVLDLLPLPAFYGTRHRLIWTAMVGLVHQGQPLDYHTVASELSRLGIYEQAGGLLALSDINLSTPTAGLIEHYAHIVADHYTRRRAIDIAQNITTEAWRARSSIDELVAGAQAAVLGLSDAASVRVRPISAGQAIMEWLDSFGEDRATNKQGDRLVGCSTGLRCMDKITLGLQPGRLYLTPAATSVGKSQLIQQVGLHVARKHGTVLMASLEMTSQELTTRAIAIETGIPVEQLAEGRVDEAECQRILKAAADQHDDPIHYLEGSDGLTSGQIRSRALQLQAQDSKRLALIIVDYGQLLTDSKGNNSSVEDQTLVSRNLKRLARELEVPVLVPVQINRQANARPEQRPRLSDIRESGSWEQDADVVVALYRDELVRPETDRQGQMELIVLKNRHAGEHPPFSARVIWQRGRYWEWDRNKYTHGEPSPADEYATVSSARLPHADT